MTQAPLRRLGSSLLAVVGILCFGAVALSRRGRRDAVPEQRRSSGAADPADRPGTGLPPCPDTGPDPMPAPTDRAPHHAHSAPRAPRTLSLALQGGGSFGAFTWGVLDRLLEEDDLVIDAVSSTNAGSVNAVVMAAGLIAGGRPEARRHLDRFWKRISETAPPQLGPAVTVFTDITSAGSRPTSRIPSTTMPSTGCSPTRSISTPFAPLPRSSSWSPRPRSRMARPGSFARPNSCARWSSPRAASP